MYKLLFVLLTLFIASPISAHVSVQPKEVVVGISQTFTVSVPNEKDNPTISVRLVLPEGIESVSPYVKVGWDIKVTENEIVWSGGSVPEGLRDEFSFRAKVPASATTLQWKAYQTYENGTVVAWDQDPNAETKHVEGMEHEEGATEMGPYSTTTVVDDLAQSGSETDMVKETPKNNPMTTYVAYAALLIAAVALAKSLKK